MPGRGSAPRARAAWRRCARVGAGSREFRFRRARIDADVDGADADRGSARDALGAWALGNGEAWLSRSVPGAVTRFPEASAGTVEKRVPITAGTTQCSFENVSAGTYAISVMHDENDNQKLDKNFFGVPTEGYGVSNNHTHAMSSPTWEESKFTVEGGKNLGLGIGLRY
ncbi:MAG TPA: DUF2141 domain-containing protein [Polyangiaceae bacterium]|nr:DUF2141 domain-containing protein [Polyangiaceae bacterium]